MLLVDCAIKRSKKAISPFSLIITHTRTNMKKFLVQTYTTVLYSAVVIADNEDMAHDIAENCCLDELFCETTCRGHNQVLEIPEGELYDLPTLQQTPEGYELV